MKPDMDPRVRRWLENNDPVRGVFETVAMSAGLTLEELGDVNSLVCRSAADLIEGRPDAREVLSHKNPLSPESEALWLRLVERGRRPGARDRG